MVWHNKRSYSTIHILSFHNNMIFIPNDLKILNIEKVQITLCFCTSDGNLMREPQFRQYKLLQHRNHPENGAKFLNTVIINIDFNRSFGSLQCFGTSITLSNYCSIRKAKKITPIFIGMFINYYFQKISPFFNCHTFVNKQK